MEIIFIRHNSTYQTAYGHMSKVWKGIRKGVSVTQGKLSDMLGQQECQPALTFIMKSLKIKKSKFTKT